MSLQNGEATTYVHTGNGELCYEMNQALTVPETFPVYLSSAYIFDSIAPIDQICDEGAPGYAYFRLGNPNADATSRILAAGEGAEKGLVFASGMAAITTAILANVKPGDHIVGGAALGSAEIIGKLSFYLGLYGSNMSATTSWLLARSLRTLPLRVKKMSKNGMALAKFFASHPKVEQVYYPGLESSPSKPLADKQFEGNGYGGMLCVNFKGGMKEIDKLIASLHLVRFVPTLAGVGTTLTYPPRASHRDLSPEELAAIGITMGQIRLSSGLEDTEDLLNDFDQALAKL